MNSQNKPALGREIPARCCPILSATIAVLVSVLVGEKTENYSKLFHGK